MVSEIQLSIKFQATLMQISGHVDALQLKMIKENPSERQCSGLVFSVYWSQGNNAVTEGSLGFNIILTQIKDPALGRIGAVYNVHHFTAGMKQRRGLKRHKHFGRHKNFLIMTKFLLKLFLRPSLLLGVQPVPQSKRQTLISLRQACKCIK